MIKVWTRPLLGVQPGSDEPVDSGQDEVMIDDGLRVAFVGRSPEDPICFVGKPNDELLQAVTEHFGADRKFSYPSVVLDKHMNPLPASEYDDE